MELRCGSLNSPCWLKPIPFDDCYIDCFCLLETSPKRDPLGSAVTMRINWDGTINGSSRRMGGDGAPVLQRLRGSPGSGHPFVVFRSHVGHLSRLHSCGDHL